MPPILSENQTLLQWGRRESFVVLHSKPPLLRGEEYRFTPFKTSEAPIPCPLTSIVEILNTRRVKIL